MPATCEICGKKADRGMKYVRRGLAKAKGGVGQRITGKTKTLRKPNLQRMRAVVNGSVKKIRVCTRCIKAGKVKRPAQ
jgi:large subunit ribosomal protein L28